MATLETYDDRPVDEITVKIMKAGDGLSKPLHFEPVLHEPGTEHTIALQAVLKKVTYEYKPTTDTFTRVETFITTDGGFMPNGDAQAFFNEQKERIRTAENRSKDPGADPLFRNDLFGKTSDTPSEEEERLMAEEAEDAVIVPPPAELPPAGQSTDTDWETPPPPPRGTDSGDEDVAPQRATRARKGTGKRAPRKSTKP